MREEIRLLRDLILSLIPGIVLLVLGIIFINVPGHSLVLLTIGIFLLTLCPALTLVAHSEEEDYY